MILASYTLVKNCDRASADRQTDRQTAIHTSDENITPVSILRRSITIRSLGGDNDRHPVFTLTYATSELIHKISHNFDSHNFTMRRDRSSLWRQVKITQAPIQYIHVWRSLQCSSCCYLQIPWLSAGTSVCQASVIFAWRRYCVYNSANFIGYSTTNSHSKLIMH